MSDVTRILSQMEAGDPLAAEQLLPLIYGELRRLATAKLAQEKPGQTLEATALVHEAYLRLVHCEESRHWSNRGHFYCAAAEAMRRILVEQARRKQSKRRGGGYLRIALSDDALQVDEKSAECDRILGIHDALDALERESPREAQLVKLRFFAGLTLEEAAHALCVSVPTVKRDWAAARVWLYRRLANK